MDPVTSAVVVDAALTSAKATLSAIPAAIKAMYNVAGRLDDWLDDHIGQMKDDDNPTISRTGRVLEAVKFGFGLGYIAPTVVIAAGQFLLGHPLSALVTLGTSATLTNPIAMTCAAVGAIYYGWGALSDQERDEIIAKLSEGFAMGIELIRAVINFVIGKTKELLNSKQIAELKEFIRCTAATFGRRLGDITQSVGDKLADAAIAAKEAASTVAKTASHGVAFSTAVAVDTAAAAAESTARGVKRASSVVTRAFRRATKETAEKLDIKGVDSSDLADNKVSRKRRASTTSKSRSKSRQEDTSKNK